MAVLAHGASIIFAARDFEARAVCDILIREQATVLHGVPTMFTAIMQELERSGRTVTTLRKGIAAGTKVPPAILTELENRLGYEHIAITYGMTETSPASFMTEVGDSAERRHETVGRAFPHIKAKIVDGENRIVPRGTRGEVCVSGWLLQQGYFRNPEKTAEVMIKDADGTVWMHTGDEGVIDNADYLTITGRIKDIIIRGELNLFFVPNDRLENKHNHKACRDSMLTQNQAARTYTHSRSRRGCFTIQLSVWLQSLALKTPSLESRSTPSYK